MLKLAIAPVPYHWPRARILSFYADLAKAPCEILYLGETVCAKRRALTPQDWLDLAETLRAAGKEVLLSSLSLIEAASEVSTQRRLCAGSEFLIEANDLGAVTRLRGREFVAGPGINLYNPRFLTRLHALGMRRWIVPIELSRQGLETMQAHCPVDVETEVIGWGRLPLAHSARCFTARVQGLAKDECALSCADHPDGLVLYTQNEQPFLCLNGVQVQSALSHCLIDAVETLQQLGIHSLRLIPQSEGFDAVLRTFDQVRRGATTASSAVEALGRLAPTGLCNGYFHGISGMDWVAPPQVPQGQASLDAPAPRKQ